MTNADKPARRGDLARVARTLKKQLGAKIDRLDAKFGRLDVRIDGVETRLGARIVNIEADLREVKGYVAKLPTRDELLTKLDGWAARFEATDRSREIRRDQLRDHGQRISALERRAWPQPG